MVAIVRHLHARIEHGLDEHLIARELDLASVNSQLRHNAWIVAIATPDSRQRYPAKPGLFLATQSSLAKQHKHLEPDDQQNQQHTAHTSDLL